MSLRGETTYEWTLRQQADRASNCPAHPPSPRAIQGVQTNDAWLAHRKSIPRDVKRAIRIAYLSTEATLRAADQVLKSIADAATAAALRALPAAQPMNSASRAAAAAAARHALSAVARVRGMVITASNDVHERSTFHSANAGANAADVAAMAASAAQTSRALVLALQEEIADACARAGVRMGQCRLSPQRRRQSAKARRPTASQVTQALAEVLERKIADARARAAAAPPWADRFAIEVGQPSAIAEVMHDRKRLYLFAADDEAQFHEPFRDLWVVGPSSIRYASNTGSIRGLHPPDHLKPAEAETWAAENLPKMKEDLATVIARMSTDQYDSVMITKEFALHLDKCPCLVGARALMRRFIRGDINAFSTEHTLPELLLRHSQRRRIPAVRQRVMSLMCGIGGDVLAALMLYFDISVLVDVCPHACRVLKSLYPSAVVLCRDVTDLHSCHEIYHRFKGQVDAVFVAFPCQPSSDCNTAKKKYDQRLLVADAGQRLAVSLNPRLIVNENVASFKRNRPDHYAEAIRILREDGKFTNIHTRITNALHFMAPQQRRRMFIFAYKLKGAQPIRAVDFVIDRQRKGYKEWARTRTTKHPSPRMSPSIAQAINIHGVSEGMGRTVAVFIHSRRRLSSAEEHPPARVIDANGHAPTITTKARVSQESLTKYTFQPNDFVQDRKRIHLPTPAQWGQLSCFSRKMPWSEGTSCSVRCPGCTVSGKSRGRPQELQRGNLLVPTQFLPVLQPFCGPLTRACSLGDDGDLLDDNELAKTTGFEFMRLYGTPGSAGSLSNAMTAELLQTRRFSRLYGYSQTSPAGSHAHRVQALGLEEVQERIYTTATTALKAFLRSSARARTHRKYGEQLTEWLVAKETEWTRAGGSPLRTKYPERHAFTTWQSKQCDRALAKQQERRDPEQHQTFDDDFVLHLAVSLVGDAVGRALSKKAPGTPGTMHSDEYCQAYLSEYSAALRRAIVDSGASHHFCTSDSILHNTRPGRGSVSVANDQTERIAEVGDAGYIRGVQKVNSFDKTLISVSELTKLVGKVVFSTTEVLALTVHGGEMVTTVIGKLNPHTRLYDFDYNGLSRHCRDHAGILPKAVAALVGDRKGLGVTIPLESKETTEEFHCEPSEEEEGNRDSRESSEESKGSACEESQPAGPEESEQAGETSARACRCCKATDPAGSPSPASFWRHAHQHFGPLRCMPVPTPPLSTTTKPSAEARCDQRTAAGASLSDEDVRVRVLAVHHANNHMSMADIRTLWDQGVDLGLGSATADQLSSVQFFCITCERSRMTRRKYNKRAKRRTPTEGKVGERILVDVVERSTRSIDYIDENSQKRGGNKHILSYVCARSGRLFSQYFSDKRDIERLMTEMQCHIEIECRTAADFDPKHPTRVLEWVSDRDSGMTSKRALSEALGRRIKKTFAASRAKNMTPLLDNKIRHFNTESRIALLGADGRGLHRKYWEFASNYAIEKMNITPTTLNAMHHSPMHRWTGIKPDLSGRIRFGANLLLHQPVEQRPDRDKMEAASVGGDGMYRYVGEAKERGTETRAPLVLSFKYSMPRLMVPETFKPLPLPSTPTSLAYPADEADEPMEEPDVDIRDELEDEEADPRVSEEGAGATEENAQPVDLERLYCTKGPGETLQSIADELGDPHTWRALRDHNQHWVKGKLGPGSVFVHPTKLWIVDPPDAVVAAHAVRHAQHSHKRRYPAETADHSAACGRYAGHTKRHLEQRASAMRVECVPGAAMHTLAEEEHESDLSYWDVAAHEMPNLDTHIDQLQVRAREYVAAIRAGSSTCTRDCFIRHRDAEEADYMTGLGVFWAGVASQGDGLWAGVVKGMEGIRAASMKSPKNFREVLRSDFREQWMEAIRAEVENLREHGVFEWEFPPGGKPPYLDSSWAFKAKPDADGFVHRLKGRLVARGFRQIYGRDFIHSYAPVCKLETFRICLAEMARRGMNLNILDIRSAYLEADIEVIQFMKPPQGVTPPQPGMVMKLLKSLYGLRSSGRSWHDKFSKDLLRWGFTRGAEGADTCLYHKRGPGGQLMRILLFVDDMAIFSDKGSTMYSELVAQIESKYQFSENPDNFFLGLEVHQLGPNLVGLNQQRYINDLLIKHGMENHRSQRTPAPGGAVTKEDCPDCEPGQNELAKPYREMIGELRWIERCTRPDISAVLSELGKVQLNPGLNHMKRLKHLMMYVGTTKHWCLPYGSKNKQEADGPMIGYTDANWGGDTDDFKSRGGYVFKSWQTAVSWSSFKLTSVALSSCESEYMAASMATQEAVWLRRVMKDMGYGDLTIRNFGSLCPRDYVKATLGGLLHRGETPITIFEDNKGAIALSLNPVMHRRSRHIHIRWHFVRQKTREGLVELVYIPTKENIADIITKRLPAATHMYLCSKLLGQAIDGRLIHIDGTSPVIGYNKSLFDGLDLSHVSAPAGIQSKARSAGAMDIAGVSKATLARRIAAIGMSVSAVIGRSTISALATSLYRQGVRESPVSGTLGVSV